MANDLSWKPRVYEVSITCHQDLMPTIYDYKQDIDFARTYEQVEQGVPTSPCSIKEGFLMFESCPCITKDLWDKVMQEGQEPPHASHRSAQPTIQSMELYFFWTTI